MKNLTMTEINEQLQHIAKKDNIKGYVAKWILSRVEDYDNNLQSIFEDLQNGCSSGIVSELIYYSDTVEFYDKYKSEIWELLNEQSEDFGHSNPLEMVAGFNGANSISSHDHFCNLLAWYGFEETARVLANELEIEI